MPPYEFSLRSNCHSPFSSKGLLCRLMSRRAPCEGRNRIDLTYYFHLAGRPHRYCLLRRFSISIGLWRVLQRQSSSQPIWARKRRPQPRSRPGDRLKYLNDRLIPLKWDGACLRLVFKLSLSLFVHSIQSNCRSSYFRPRPSLPPNVPARTVRMYFCACLTLSFHLADGSREIVC